jgi:CRP-like cAMP-binding protein
MQNYKKGHLFFINSELNTSLFFIINGSVKLYKEDINGLEFIIDIATIKEYFGAGSIAKKIINNKTHHTAQAISEIELLIIPTRVIQDLMLQDQRLIINLLNDDIATKNKYLCKLERVSTQTTTQRVGNFLLDLCLPSDDFNIVLQLPYDKAIIASFISMRPETFSRALSKIISITNIRIENDTIYIPSIQDLIKKVCLK